MGKSFYQEFAVFRHVFEEASEALKQDLKALCFDGPESDLTLTENAQPAILAVSTGCYRVAVEKLGIQTSVNLGHSLGEYSALVASGAFPFSRAIQWVKARGLAMQAAVPIGVGSMCAIIGAEDAQVETWCLDVTDAVGKPVEPANFNAPGQVVVSGAIEAITAIEALIAKLSAEKAIRGVMAKRLNVSAPFHSSLMKPARNTMKNIFQLAKKDGLPAKLTAAYIPNRTAIMTSESSVVFSLLEEQMDHSVLWTQGVTQVMNQGFERAYEFGPGKVLQGLAKRISKHAGKPLEVTPIYDLETLKAAEQIV